MRRLMLFLCIVIGAGCLVSANSPTAYATSVCTFNSASAFADGAEQTVNESGCNETIPSATGSQGSTVSGSLNLADGTISGQLQTKGDATASVGGSIIFGTTVGLPTNNSLFPGSGGPPGPFLRIGNITYDVSRVDFTVSGTEKVTVNNSGQALGAFVGLNYTIGAGQGLIGTAGAVSLGAVALSTNAVVCGSGFTICNSFNKPWSVTSQFSLSPFVTQPTNLSSVDFTMTMSEALQLSSDMPLSNNPSIDAADPFTITSMELLDANGVPIPGLTFTADDGTIFADAADMAAAPIPATLPLFVSGIGGLGLFGWRKKRKAQAVAA